MSFFQLAEEAEYHRYHKLHVLTFYYLLFLSDQYVIQVYVYFKEWRKNPYWSLSCCLAFFLPLISLPGEISGLVGTNIINNQLQTGDIELPTIATAVQDSGAIDVTLEEGEQGDVNPVEANDGSHNDVQLKAGEEEMPSKVAAMQGSGTVNVSLEEAGSDQAEVQEDNLSDAQTKNEGKEMTINTTVRFAVEEDEGDDDYPKKVQRDNYQDVAYKTKQRHQETQTELSTTLSIADAVAPDPVAETSF